MDASDRSRFEEARAELANLAGADEIGETPIVVMANKCDSPVCVH